VRYLYRWLLSVHHLFILTTNRAKNQGDRLSGTNLSPRLVVFTISSVEKLLAFRKTLNIPPQKVIRQQLDNEAKGRGPTIDASNAPYRRCESDGTKKTHSLGKRKKLNYQRKKSNVFLSVDGVDPAQTCSICLNDYNDGDEICWSHNRKCSHFFHRACIEEWLLRHDACPCCRCCYFLTSSETICANEDWDSTSEELRTSAALTNMSLFLQRSRRAISDYDIRYFREDSGHHHCIYLDLEQGTQEVFQSVPNLTLSEAKDADNPG
jgi:hypothetical protein